MSTVCAQVLCSLSELERGVIKYVEKEKKLADVDFMTTPLKLLSLRRIHSIDEVSDNLFLIMKEDVFPRP